MLGPCFICDICELCTINFNFVWGDLNVCCVLCLLKPSCSLNKNSFFPSLLFYSNMFICSLSLYVCDNFLFSISDIVIGSFFYIFYFNSVTYDIYKLIFIPFFLPSVDCPHPNCTGHGYCTSEGNCLCKRGWKGADCSVTDSDALQCLPNCSGHGAFDLETQTCTCERMWSGDDCSKGMNFLF